MRDFMKDIGKFIFISYKIPNGKDRFCQGKLDSVEKGILTLINVKKPEEVQVINSRAVEITEYSAKPVGDANVR